jgi:hypothetical protein
MRSTFRRDLIGNDEFLDRAQSELDKSGLEIQPTGPDPLGELRQQVGGAIDGAREKLGKNPTNSRKSRRL